MKIRKFINKKHHAAIGLEGMFTVPVAFLGLLFVLVMVYCATAYVEYGNLANKTSQYMNARNTQLSHNELPVDNAIFNKAKNGSVDSMVYGTTMDVNGHANGNDDENLKNMLKTALMQVAYNGHIEQNSDGSYKYIDTKDLKSLDVPFTTITKVVAATEHPIKVDDEEGNQGDTVKVTVHFSFQNPFTKNDIGDLSANGINEIH